MYMVGHYIHLTK